MLLVGGGTTFFVIFVCRSKFAKEVGKRVVDHCRARRRRILQNALRELQYHARMYKEHKATHMNYLFKGRTLIGLLKQNNKVSVKSARNLRDSERIQSKKYWNILEKHGELPIDTITGRRWKEFDDFLDRADVTEDACA
jgi:hypothetical protein